MDQYILINEILLCILNAIFSLSGIFLNSMVIISFLSSPLLRRKTCYFLVLVLACYDLAVSGFNHPILILHSLGWWRRDSHQYLGHLTPYIRLFLYSNSFIALLGMNVERYLALTFPFFHEKAVTKQKILTALLLTQFGFVILIILGF